jgi:hypothetical protein
MSTCFQSVISSNGEVSMRKCPIMPTTSRREFFRGKNVKVIRRDGTVITWYQDGTVIENVGGIKHMYDPKPNMNTSIHCEFTAGGGIMNRIDERNMRYWSANLAGEPEEGDVFYDHYCGDRMVWDDECEGKCCVAGIEVGICECCGVVTKD